jgi:hypothetical protein
MLSPVFIWQCHILTDRHQAQISAALRSMLSPDVNGLGHIFTDRHQAQISGSLRHSTFCIHSWGHRVIGS